MVRQRFDRSPNLAGVTGNGGHGLANLKKVLGLQFKHHDAGEDARAAAEVTLKAEASMGRKIRLLNASQQLVFDFQ
ncbi:hypothetical protein [Octadecabacter ascidiaceicola]|uniref:hypothetical protein n=1 Tax=Octadecabacter ascidiaceicola TaxID=1655543 RepID=UPI0027B99568|nr:hypothetical protein [Octadecabacter ascidiaceicola]